ncbi:unnamed protein product, partial [Brassica oleracea]
GLYVNATSVEVIHYLWLGILCFCLPFELNMIQTLLFPILTLGFCILLFAM